MIDPLGARVEADRVVAGGKDDAFYAGPARRLEDIVQADDVSFENHRPRVLARDAAEMDNPVDAGSHALDRSHVRKLGAVDFFSITRRRHGQPIGKAQNRIDTAQGLAQRPADPSRRSGDQYPFHSGSSSPRCPISPPQSFAKIGRPDNGFAGRPAASLSLFILSP
jgi:hypothetical protein